MPEGRNSVNVTPVCCPASVILRSSVGSWRSVGSSSEASSQRWWSWSYSASKRGRSATEARARASSADFCSYCDFSSAMCSLPFGNVQGTRCVKKYTPRAPPPRRTDSRSFCTPGLLMSKLAMVRRLLVGALVWRHLTADLELHDVLVAGLTALGHGELDVREHRRTLDPRHEVRHDQVGIGDPLQLKVVARILRDP